MAKQQLDGAHVGALLQQVHGEGVTQGVRRDGLGNVAEPMGFLAC
jgi:hypothetical protein